MGVLMTVEALTVVFGPLMMPLVVVELRVVPVLPGPVGPVELLGSPRGLGGGRCCFSEGDAADTRMKAAAGKRGGWCHPPGQG